MHKIKKTNLNELVGQFSFTLSNSPIKYLVIGQSNDIKIYDLEEITAKCRYQFDLSNIQNTNRFENNHVNLQPNQIFGSKINYDFTYNELVKILKIHFSKNAYGQVINYINDAYREVKEYYKFIKYITDAQVIIYSPSSHLLVNIEEDTDLYLFANLEVIDYEYPQIYEKLCKQISVDEYRVLSYCVNNLK